MFIKLILLSYFIKLVYNTFEEDYLSMGLDYEHHKELPETKNKTIEKNVSVLQNVVNRNDTYQIDSRTVIFNYKTWETTTTECSTTTVRKTTKMRTKTKKQFFPIYPEYHYIDEEEVEKPKLALRFDYNENEYQEINDSIIYETKNEYTTVADATVNRYTKRKHTQDNITKYEPATITIDIDPNNFTVTSKLTWFVYEEVPCFSGTMLYAEFVKVDLDYADQIYFSKKANLKNVHLLEDDETEYEFKVDKTFRFRENPYCYSPPCFRDHIFCKYAVLEYGPHCDLNYRVAIPTRQTSRHAVNLVNSMRNKVALGIVDSYKHLPTAANMNKIIYSKVLENISQRWLFQCNQGLPKCASTNNEMVTYLECFKIKSKCCMSLSSEPKQFHCIPSKECHVTPVIGCLYLWFNSAKDKLTANDIKCGHVSQHNFETAQLFWAKTDKMGCAVAREEDYYKVLCSFAPGMDFRIQTESYCGLLDLKDKALDISEIYFISNNTKIVSASRKPRPAGNNPSGFESYSLTYADIIRRIQRTSTNGTTTLALSQVTQYKALDPENVMCDNENSTIYIPGKPGSRCDEVDNDYEALCYPHKEDNFYRMLFICLSATMLGMMLYDYIACDWG